MENLKFINVLQGYSTGELPTHDIMNHRQMLDFFDYTTPNFKELFKFTGNNTNLFKEKFGKQSTSFRSEYLHRIWAFFFEDRIFLVLTGNRGTSIEYTTDEDNDTETNRGDRSLRFFKEFWKQFYPDMDMLK
jgi:hypothetical protein